MHASVSYSVIDEPGLSSVARALFFKIHLTTEERPAFSPPSSSWICGTDDVDFLRLGDGVRVAFEEP